MNYISIGEWQMKLSLTRIAVSLMVGLSALTAASLASANWSGQYNRSALYYPINLTADTGQLRHGQLWVGAHGPYNEYTNSEPTPSPWYANPQVAKVQMVCSDWSNDPGTLTGLFAGSTVTSKQCNQGAVVTIGKVYLQQ
jgi:hypothetical protein